MRLISSAYSSQQLDWILPHVHQKSVRRICVYACVDAVSSSNTHTHTYMHTTSIHKNFPGCIVVVLACISRRDKGENNHLWKNVAWTEQTSHSQKKLIIKSIDMSMCPVQWNGGSALAHTHTHMHLYIRRSHTIDFGSRSMQNVHAIHLSAITIRRNRNQIGQNSDFIDRCILSMPIIFAIESIMVSKFTYTHRTPYSTKNEYGLPYWHRVASHGDDDDMAI